MALVVEDGTGIATADSYVSVADVTTYLAAHHTTAQLAAWTAASSGDKEIATRNAARFMVASYRSLWIGVRANDDQGLDWPRIGSPDRAAFDSINSIVTADGVSFEDDEVPTEIIAAQCELALRAIAGELVEDVGSSEAGIASESKSIGSLSKSVSYISGGKRTQTEYALVDRMLEPFMESGGRVVRG